MPETPPAPDYDLGNTELDLRQPDGLPVETKPVPPKDPVTGRFVSPDAFETPVASHSAVLVQYAKDLGYTDDEIKEFSTPALTAAVTRAYRDRERIRGEFANQRSFDQNAVKTPAPSPTLSRTPPEQDDFDFSDVESQGYAPELLAAIKRNMKKLADQHKPVKDKLEAFEKREQEREQSSTRERIDLAFEALGDGYQKIFGAGSGNDLMAAGTPEYDRRCALISVAALKPEDLTSAKRIHAKLKAAAERIYPLEGAQEGAGVYEDALRKPSQRITPEQWKNGTVARPTERKGSGLPPGDEKAIKNLAARMREDDAVVDSEVLDGLL